MFMVWLLLLELVETVEDNEISMFYTISLCVHRATRGARHASSHVGRSGRACPSPVATGCRRPSPVPRVVLELAVVQGGLPTEPYLFIEQRAQESIRQIRPTW